MHQLTRSAGDSRGASEEELLKAMHLPEKLGRGELHKRLIEFDTYLHPVGLQVRANPLDNHWFVAFREEISENMDLDGFAGKPRLSATLLATIVSGFKFGNKIPLSAIQEMRKKQSLLDDLKHLKRLNYVNIEGDFVRLTPLIGYHLDLLKLFETITEQMAKQQKNAKNASPKEL